MPAALLGQKIGMTPYFLEDGKNIPVTVIEAGPCVVTQVKTTETDDYSAVQLAFEDVKPRRSTMPIIGHDARANSGPNSFLHIWTCCLPTEWSPATPLRAAI